MNKANTGWLTQEELHRKWDVSYGTIKKWRKEGLKCYMVGKNVCFLDSDVTNFILDKREVTVKHKDSPTENPDWNNLVIESKVKNESEAKDGNSDDAKQPTIVAS